MWVGDSLEQWLTCHNVRESLFHCGNSIYDRTKTRESKLRIWEQIFKVKQHIEKKQLWQICGVVRSNDQLFVGHFKWLLNSLLSSRMVSYSHHRNNVCICIVLCGGFWTENAVAAPPVLSSCRTSEGWWSLISISAFLFFLGALQTLWVFGVFARRCTAFPQVEDHNSLRDSQLHSSVESNKALTLCRSSSPILTSHHQMMRTSKNKLVDQKWIAYFHVIFCIQSAWSMYNIDISF